MVPVSYLHMHKTYSSFLFRLLLIAPLTSWAACNIINGKAYGDCQNVQVNQGARPALKVRNHVVESGIVEGATVYASGSLDLSGIANGNVSVTAGGRLSVTGVVNATVRNNGGQVEIEGVVDHLISNGGLTVVGGQVGSVSGKGPVIFKKGSVLQGKPFEHRHQFPTTSTARSGDLQ